ncbi:hypothetical protein D3C87_1705980 [compost metagenome]
MRSASTGPDLNREVATLFAAILGSHEAKKKEGSNPFFSSLFVPEELTDLFEVSDESPRALRGNNLTVVRVRVPIVIVVGQRQRAFHEQSEELGVLSDLRNQTQPHVVIEVVVEHHVCST